MNKSDGNGWVEVALGIAIGAVLLASVLLYVQGKELEEARKSEAELLNRLVVAEREYDKVERLAQKLESRRGR